MAFLNIEKPNKIKKPKDNYQNKRVNVNTTNNDGNDYTGVNGDIIKREANLLSTIMSTIIETVIVLLIIILLIFIGLNISKFRIQFFTLADEHSLSNYNDAIKRSFLVLSGSLIVFCFIVKFVINNAIRSRFRQRYLRKFNIYLYDLFIFILNGAYYILISFLFFYIVNSIHNSILSITFLEEVNKDTIEIFKYVIVTVIAIFGVLNSFSGISIVHKKNKFVLEDYYAE